MARRSYFVGVVTEHSGERHSHHGFLQLDADSSDHLGQISAAVQNTFDTAVEYLPLPISNRQYDKMTRDAWLRQLTMSLIDIQISEELISIRG